MAKRVKLTDTVAMDQLTSLIHRGATSTRRPLHQPPVFTIRYRIAQV